MNPDLPKKYLTPFSCLSFVNLGFATIIFSLNAYQYWSSGKNQFLVIGFLILAFMLGQLVALRFEKRKQKLASATWILIWTLLLCILPVPLFIKNALFACLFTIAVIPLFVAMTGQLKQLPSVLFLAFVASAMTILVDLANHWLRFQLAVDYRQSWMIASAGGFVYLLSFALISYRYNRLNPQEKRSQINVATQYVLFFTGISAFIIFLVTAVMISQVRNFQTQQVGKNFESIAGNFAKLMGSHLEQEIQKLQFLTQQLPILQESLIQSNNEYTGGRLGARNQLLAKNHLWQGSKQDDAFIMKYLDNPMIRALRRFQGHNSLHDDLLLVDNYGGLVASLGQKPARFYFFDQNWWKIAWNSGLGNIFIGNFTVDKHTGIPKLRIAVAVIDHATNKVVGVLSSFYSLQTLFVDMQRFKPDSVDQISLIDADGRVIASTSEQIESTTVWQQLGAVTASEHKILNGWVLGRDQHNQPALIGYSALSTAYNVISDPLHRLGWKIVVSGTRSSALSGVTQSTKLALFVGLMAMALGVLGAIAAARVITSPIENLTATASAMIEGDLDKRAQLAGPEELVALSTGFNQLTDRLHEVIRDLKSQTEQLVKAKGEAEAATKIKGEFLAKMSHEIRTPLNAILGFADILESSIEDIKLKRHAQIIRTSGADLLHLINDILDISKIEAGYMEIQTSTVNLRVLFVELQRIFAISAEEKMIDMEIQVANDVPTYLLLDRVRLRQVLFNLIGNAFKFTDRGKITCQARAEAAAQIDHWDLKIEVSDTGIGISPAAYGEIFETFRQHRVKSDSIIDGTGLGLAISKSLIEMMGGGIYVKGEPGKGALFTIHLPNVPSVDAEQTSHEGDVADMRSDEHIRFERAAVLVADDLQINRQLIIEALASSPLNIDQAVDGREAVALALEKRYSLILLDIRMPNMDGYAALKEIRSGNTVHIPIIAITASGMKEDITRIEQAGFDDYLIRPYGQAALVRLLARFLPHDYIQETLDVGIQDGGMAPFVAGSVVPWLCPADAEHYILTTLRQQWEQVAQKQSISDIFAFAREVQAAGDRYQVALLSHYGSELTEYAEAFDINNVERLLNIFEDILNHRISSEDTKRDTPI